MFRTDNDMKTHKIIWQPRGVFLVGVFLFGTLGHLLASPTSDLASTNQEVRDAAAKILRETYVPPARTKWDALVEKMKVGSLMTNFTELLAPYTNNAEGGGGSGIVGWVRYRLDDLWLLELSYTARSSSNQLIHCKLIEQIRDVWVEPPNNFTGVWRTYSANGQLRHEFQYKNGQLEGLLTTFYPDGSKCYTAQQHNGLFDGEGIGFYPSGRIKYKGQSKVGVQVGTWTWYNEDGTVQSKKEFPPPPQQK
jgi:hypothetical protein